MLLFQHDLTMPAISKPILTTLALACCLLTSACGEKSEPEQLAAMRDSLVYTQYRNLSESGMPLALQAYQVSIGLSGEKDLPHFSTQDICMARVVLAYGAVASGKHRVALAEADMVEQGKCAAIETGAAMSLQSVVFQRESWPNLAQQRSAEAQAFFEKNKNERQNANQLLMLHMSLSMVFLMGKQYDQALPHMESVALQLKEPWIGIAGHAIVAIEKGDLSKGIVLMKRLSEDSSTPAELKAELKPFIAKVESEAGNIDAPALLLRILVAHIWQALKTKGPTEIARLAKFSDQQLAQLPKIDTQDVQTSWDKLRGLWESQASASATK